MWPTKDSVIPVLMLFLRRFLDGIPAANQFEKEINKFLTNLAKDKLDALRLGLKAYEELPEIKRECIFETRFDKCDNNEVLDPFFILKVWISQAIRFGNDVMYDQPSGISKPGQVRPWERKFPKPPNGGGYDVLIAPWPWICSVNTGIDNRGWYQNHDISIPGNLSTDDFVWEDYNFSKKCEQKPDLDGRRIILDCTPETPPVGQNSFSAGCHDNLRYDVFSHVYNKTVCTKIPWAITGQEMKLRGLNFFSSNCKVRIKKLGGGFQDIVLDCAVLGDHETPLERDGKVVATCEVRDIVTFVIPEKIRSGLNDISVPPGRYSIEVIVSNDIGYAPTAGGSLPPEFVSVNTVWIDLQPHPDTMYGLWTDEAFCYEETDGPGSDEPWFTAFVARYVPDGTQVVPFQDTVDIMRADDVDSGEPIGFNRAQLFRDKLKIGEVCAFGVIGIEVDSEDAAKQQIKKFGDAYLEYWKQFYSQLGVSAGSGFLADALKTLFLTGKVTLSAYVGGAILVAVAVIGIFWALWAPADPIAYDFMIFGAQTLFDLTDPTTSVPPKTSFALNNIGISIYPRSDKQIDDPGGTKRIYIEDHDYNSTDENSHYRLTYKVGRPGF